MLFFLYIFERNYYKGKNSDAYVVDVWKDCSYEALKERIMEETLCEKFLISYVVSYKNNLEIMFPNYLIHFQ
jgi:hypothetical protein